MDHKHKLLLERRGLCKYEEMREEGVKSKYAKAVLCQSCRLPCPSINLLIAFVLQSYVYSIVCRWVSDELFFKFDVV
jgi:hypothetical protein